MATDDLKDAMQSLRKPRPAVSTQTQEPVKPPAKAKTPARGKAKAAKATKPKKSAAAKRKPAPVKPAAEDPVLIPEIVENVGEDSQNGISLKDQMTLQELKFIELLLVGKMTVENAMKSAGYEGYHPSYLYRLGRKIVQKYESLADDHRKIMREMGYGETKVIELLIDSAENASSDMVKLQARIALAKCLGLQKEVIDVQHGINIIIKSRSQTPQQEPVQGGSRPALVRQIEHKPGPKAISITK